MPSIRSSRVVLPDGAQPATVTYDGGRVVDVGHGPADHDLGDLVVLPGLVDSHVHVNQPGRTDWEGFSTATAAAAAGGTTTVVDMPLNSIPPTVDVAALDAKRAATTGRLAVDVAFWAGVIPGSQGSIPALVAEDVCGFKVFLADSGVPEFPHLGVGLLAPVAAAVAAGGVPLLVHAEEPSLLRPPRGDPRRHRTWLESRPGAAESAAIDAVARAARGDVHILHVAGQEAVEAVARSRGTVPLTAETCPHYLTFDADEIPDGATSFKCAPPIRGKAHREALWEALGEGVVDMVVSDHSPAPPAVKDPGGGDFVAAWGGIASLELRLPATWTGARHRGFGVEHIARWLAEAPAELAGLGHRKGRIAVGHDADLVVFEPDGSTPVDAASLRQRHAVSPYDGMVLAGSVVATMLAGRFITGPGAERGRHGQVRRRGT